MKPEYDFSEGTRGKFHRTDARLRLPIELDADVQQFVERVAEARQSDITTVVNELLRSHMRVAEIVR